MNIVSGCCHREIVGASQFESPDGSGYGYTYKVDVCSGCGKEVDSDYVELCECCGLPNGPIIETKLGGWCEKCVHDYAEDLMERVG